MAYEIELRILLLCLVESASQTRNYRLSREWELTSLSALMAMSSTSSWTSYERSSLRFWRANSVNQLPRHHLVRATARAANLTKICTMMRVTVTEVVAVVIPWKGFGVPSVRVFTRAQRFWPKTVVLSSVESYTVNHCICNVLRPSTWLPYPTQSAFRVPSSVVDVVRTSVRL